jgi:hypothetical protein
MNEIINEINQLSATINKELDINLTISDIIYKLNIRKNAMKHLYIKSEILNNTFKLTLKKRRKYGIVNGKFINFSKYALDESTYVKALALESLLLKYYTIFNNKILI